MWRRSATAIGTYAAAGLGFLTTVAATRELGVHDYAKFAAVIAATSFFQSLLDLTIEEALVKFGFRYAETERWGRLRRLFEVAVGFKLVGGLLAAVAVCALAPFSKAIWGTSGVVVPMLVASLLPLAQSPENVAAGAIILRGRYDIRGWFLAVSMGLRLVGLVIGCRYGVVGGVIGMVLAQFVATAAIGVVGVAAFMRFPAAAAEPLGDDVRGLRSFLFSSTLASSLDSARGTLGTSLVPTVAPIVEAGYFRNAQAPATGFAALSGPVRLVMLTEQTRDFEAGKHDRVMRMLNRYVASTAALMVVAVPVLWVVMPFLIGLAYGPDFRAHATDAARLVLVAAALPPCLGLDEVVPGLDRASRSARDRAERRDRRLRAAAPLVRLDVGGDRCRGRDARLDGRCSACCGAWSCCGCAGRGESTGGGGVVRVLVVSGIWPPDVGGPASHAPEVAGVPAPAGPRRRGGDHGGRPAGSRGVPRSLGEPLAAARGQARGDGAPARFALAPGGCRLHDGDARPLVARVAPRPHAVRHEAHCRPGLRARPALGDRRRLPRGVPALAGRRPRCRCACTATSTSGAPPTSSRRRRTCASWRSGGASGRTG